MEVITSLEIAHPTKVTNQVERANARATRNAKARTRSCSQLEATLGVHEPQWKADRQWDWQILSGRSLSVNQIQKFG